jgi:hypothetical protein
LVVVTAAVALVVSVRHQRWQRPMKRALDAAKKVAARNGARELGVLFHAVKVGVLFPGPVRLETSDIWRSQVVLCNEHSASYRARENEGTFACAAAGYRAQYRADGFAVLVRDDGQRR